MLVTGLPQSPPCKIPSDTGWNAEQCNSSGQRDLAVPQDQPGTEQTSSLQFADAVMEAPAKDPHRLAGNQGAEVYFSFADFS